jgi:hypothetical protein
MKIIEWQISYLTPLITGTAVVSKGDIFPLAQKGCERRHIVVEGV